MSSVTVRAAAKINLHLGVGPLRSDGFHPLSTVYQAIGLYDDLTAYPADEWAVDVVATGSVDLHGVPRDDSNLAVRAGRMLLAHHGRTAAARLEIAKGIPVAGGLAGGSADAAAALVAVDRLFGLETSDDDLLALAAKLGSDVPFALIGGTAHGHGRGEIVQPVTDRGEWWWVVVPAEEGLATPAVYRRFDDGYAGSVERPEALLRALAEGDPTALADRLHNDLQPPALSLRAELGDTLDALGAAGALGVLLSGSGPTCLGLAADAVQAREIVDDLRSRGHQRAVYAPAPVAGAHVVEY